MKAIILAAGYATRLYPLTLNRPKAMLPIGGAAMLDYLVREMALIPQLDEVHIVTNHKVAAQFEKWCDEVERDGRSRRYGSSGLLGGSRGLRVGRLANARQDCVDAHR